MDREEIEVKRFELEQKIQLEELEIKKKELELKIQEQRRQTVFTPIIITLVGGLITLITGIVLNYFEKKSVTELEDKKLQSTLLVKAVEAESYDEFSEMLLVLSDMRLISLDSSKMAEFRKSRYVKEKLEEAIIPTGGFPASSLVTNEEDLFEEDVEIPKTESNSDIASEVYWMVIAGGDSNLDAAKYEVERATKRGYDQVGIWLKGNSFRTVIGKYNSYQSAVEHLFDIKEQLNKTSYIVRSDSWCSISKVDPERGIMICEN